MLGGKGLISTTEWPKYDEEAVDVKAEETVEMIKKLVEDVSNIVKATRTPPKKVIVYTCSSWKTRIYHEALNQGKPLAGDLIKKAKADPEVKASIAQIVKFVNNIIKEVTMIPQDLMKKKINALNINEKEVLLEAKTFIEKEVKAPVEIYSEEEQEIYDPKSRAGLSQPLRPAIYIE